MTVDHERLGREIDEEVRRRRAAGDLPAGLEQELDDAFAARAPRGALGADLDDLLLDVEEQSFFDTMAPLASARPGGAVMKRTLRTLLGFYMRHVTTQMGTFAHATGRALRALAARLESVEQQVGGVGAAGDSLLHDALAETRASSAALEGTWRDLVDAARVGAPSPALSVAGDDALARLAQVADSSLGAVIVGSDVEHRGRGWKVRLVELIGQKASGGAVVVVVSCEPGAWPPGGSPVVADLAPGRPLHAETWVWLLARQGFVDTSVERNDDPPASFAIVARRPARV